MEDTRDEQPENQDDGSYYTGGGYSGWAWWWLIAVIIIVVFLIWWWAYSSRKPSKIVPEPKLPGATQSISAEYSTTRVFNEINIFYF